MKPSMRVRFAPLAASTAFSASAAFRAKGFSQRTCLPAAMAFNVHSTCSELGRGT
jgi:hypothetical protein